MTPPADGSLPATAFRRAVGLCDQFEAAFQAGRSPAVEDFLADAADTERPAVLRLLLALELDLRRAAGETPTPDEYLDRFPADRASVRAAFADITAAASPGPPARLGNYELLGELGRGGMGVVYQARQRGTERVVALKLIRPDLLGLLPSGDAAVLDRFRAEARSAALEHEHIVPVYEVGEADGHCFYSMRHLDGGSLADALRAGPLPNRRAAEVLAAVAGAVHHAHAHGVVHRDLKPRNILLDAGGKPYVADFGLARRLDASCPLTAGGAPLGTAAYMAPEQARDAAGAGAASDVYSLGATLYECLTGRPPFLAADAVETLRQARDDDPVPPRRLNPAVARDLQTVCLKCLEKDPAKRYATAAALADDLNRYLDGRPILARPVGVVDQAVKWARRRPAAAALVGLLIAAVPVAAAVGVYFERRIAATQLDGLVSNLLTADVGEVPGILRDLAPFGAAAGPALAHVRALNPPDSAGHFRAALAAFHFEPSLYEYLYERAFQADPEDLALIREIVRPHPPGLADQLWAVLDDPRAEADRRLRAACWLAAVDPDGPRWTTARDVVLERLLTDNPLQTGGWARLLRPARAQLEPPLRAAFRDATQPERGRVAAAVLAEYRAGDAPALADLLAEADAAQAEFLLAKLRTHGGRAVEALRERLKANGPWTSDAAGAERRAAVAAALATLGSGADVWDLLGAAADPYVRLLLIYRLGPLRPDVGALLARLAHEPDAAARQALLLILGECPDGHALREDRDVRRATVRKVLRSDPDAGVHSAAAWLLRRWGDGDAVAAADRDLAAQPPPPGQNWLVTREGHTLALVPMHGVRFGLGTREVTVAQFRRCAEDIGGDFRDLFLRNHAAVSRPDDVDYPVSHVSFNDAAVYCNWLSRREGIPADQWCYERSPKNSPRHRMNLRPGADAMTGYRLPRQREWEAFERFDLRLKQQLVGRDDLWRRQFWLLPNSRKRLQPAGRLWPNSAGLFDIYGNVAEWGHDRTDTPMGTKQDLANISFLYQPEALLTGPHWGRLSPEHEPETVGLRIARIIVSN